MSDAAQFPSQAGVDARSAFIKAPAGPPPWSLIPTYALTFAKAAKPLAFPTLLLLVSFYFLRRLSLFIIMYRDEPRLFPFMELPPELRDMVYEELVEDPHYPPPPPCTKHQHNPLDWILPARWSPAPSHSTPQPSQGKQSNWIFLANKQIYQEYMDVLRKRATYHLTVSPDNYMAPTTPATTKSSTKKIWNISEETLKSLRKCDLKLVTTSGMLGVSDPRNMSSDEWELGRLMREELKHVVNVRELNLHVKAIGDPLWNPLWIWYHASQSFKGMGTAQSDTVPNGPKLNRITFSLDTWSPGENYLERDPENKNQWTWYCLSGHCVEVDDKPETTVREFCARLYKECRTCRPDLDSEDEGESEDDE